MSIGTDRRLGVSDVTTPSGHGWSGDGPREVGGFMDDGKLQPNASNRLSSEKTQNTRTRKKMN